MGGTVDKVSTYLLQPEGSQEETNESDPRLEARSPPTRGVPTLGATWI